MYSRFRHPCNSQTTLKTTLVLLHKLFQYSCLWLIKLTTPVVLVITAFLLQRCLNLLYMWFRYTYNAYTWYPKSVSVYTRMIEALKA